MTMESTQLRNIIEGALLAAGEPLNLARLTTLFEEDAAPTKEALLTALEEIATDCEGRGYELKEVASGWRFQVRADMAPWVNRLWEEKPQKYSRAVLETLALVAYRQPITRGDIEEIRGVAVSSHIIKSLTERDWIKVVGHRDVPGRPALYATTRQFLDYFNLKSLDELPSLGDIRDLEEINELLDLGDAPNAEAPAIDEEMFDEQALEQQHINDPTLNESPGDDDMETGDDMDRFDQSSANESSANESSANEGPAEASAADMSAREQEWEQEANTQTNSDPDEIPGAPGKPEQPDLPGTPDAPELPEEPTPEPEINPEPMHPEIPNQPVTPEIPPAPDTPELESEHSDTTSQGSTPNSEEPHSA